LAAAGGARFINSFLYGVAGIDLFTVTAVSLALALVTIAASLSPARRVARADPANVFRSM
jgi:ABC-type lipoprotein release transport system permease subunit